MIYHGAQDWSRIADIEITVSEPRTGFTVSGFRASHIKAAPESWSRQFDVCSKIAFYVFLFSILSYIGFYIVHWITIFQCAIKIVTDRSDFLKGIAWKNWVFFKSIYYLIYTKRWKIFLLTEFSIFYLKILLKNRYSIHTVLRKRCSSNITLNSLVGPELFNRHLKAVENLDGFFLSEIF